MLQLLDPKIDFVFKNIFGNKSKLNILISFLNAVLTFPDGCKIVSLTIDDSYIKKEHLDDKYSILDIKATLDDKSRVNIEIQLYDPGYMEKRTLYYLSRLYSEQLTQGIRYDKLTKTIIIVILNYNLIENQQYHNHFLFKEKNTNLLLTDLMQIHILELLKFLKAIGEYDGPLDYWIGFLKEPTEETVTMLAEKVPEIGDAFEVLKVVSRSKKTRRDYEIREKSLKDRASMKSWYMKKGIEEGVKKGREKGVKEGREDAILQTAKNFKNAGVGLDIISKSTGLSLDEIQKL